MKPSDLEKYTAGIDGREQELTDAAKADRTEAQQLGALLRSHYAQAPAPELKNAEFFNQQILRQIAAETPQPSAPSPAPFPWPFRRLLWGAAASLGTAAILFAAMVLPVLHQQGPPPEYYAQILNAQTSDPAISAVAFHSEEENVTVLWIDGLDYLPKTAAKN